MKIEEIQLHYVCLPFVHPFSFSSGTEFDHPCIIVSVVSEGIVGWAECPVYIEPIYCYETIETAWHILSDILIPTVLGKTFESPQEVSTQFKPVRGHPMAKSALEGAVWDLMAKTQGIPLSQLLGGVRQRVPVGVSVGIQPTLGELLDRVAQFVDQGYRRVKLKIAPGWELEPLRAIRERYPDLALMADANAAFSLEDADLFKEMDSLELLMIEQPLDYDDLWDHAKLQAQLKTPICLDESLKSARHVQQALEIGACRIVNLKVSRVGGITQTLMIHEICQNAGIPMWCGGMTESGIGRAMNLHLASLPNFILPGDISATQRYFKRDIAVPEFTLNTSDSTINVPLKPGIGVDVDVEYLEQVRKRFKAFKA